MLIRAQDGWIDLLSRTLSAADLYLIQLLASSVLKDSRFATSLSMSLVRRRERCHAAAAATSLMLDIRIYNFIFSINSISGQMGKFYNNIIIQ